MAHEQSITIQRDDGSWVNISGVVNGKSAPEKAEQLFREGKRKPLGGIAFPTVEKAIEAAKRRSETFKEGELR